MLSPMLNDITLALPFPMEIHKIKEGEEGFHEPTKILRMRIEWDVKFHFLGGQMRKKIIID